MTLIINGRFSHDKWRLQAEADLHHLRNHDIVSLAALAETTPVESHALPAHFGILVADPYDEVGLEPWLARVELVAIEFPSLADGRGFSVAHRVRACGYEGHLRAVGPLIADQYPHLRAAGFDSISIPDTLAERHTELDWHKAWRLFSSRYQGRPASGLSSILCRRHGADAAGSTPGFAR